MDVKFLGSTKHPKRKTETKTLEYLLSRESKPTRLIEVVAATGISKASALTSLRSLYDQGLLVAVGEINHSKMYIHKMFSDRFDKESLEFKKDKTISWRFVFGNMRKC